MKAQVLYGINDLRFENDYPEPVLKNDEVLVKVKACGICGSDIDRVLKNGTYRFPTIIGHEFSGVVAKVSSRQNEKWQGKRVSIFPLIPCGRCSSCKSGNFQLCEDYNYLGSRCNGGFSEYVAVPAWNLIEIPKNVSFEEAAMMEPVSVALHSLKIAGNILGRNVVILGAGTIASVLAQMVISSGAAKAVVAARNEKKLDFITNICNGVHTVNSDTKDFLEMIKDIFGGEADVVIEGTGASLMIEKAIAVTKRKGSIVLLGNPVDDVHISKKVFWQILRKEITLKGTWNSSFGISGSSDWEDNFEFIKTNKLQLKKLISHRIALSELKDGILKMKNKDEITNKIMVVFDE